MSINKFITAKLQYCKHIVEMAYNNVKCFVNITKAKKKYGKQIGEQAISGVRCFGSKKDKVTTYTILDKDFNIIRTKTVKKFEDWETQSVVKDSNGLTTDTYTKYIVSKGPDYKSHNIIHIYYRPSSANGETEEAYITSGVIHTLKDGTLDIWKTRGPAPAYFHDVDITHFAKDGTKTIETLPEKEFCSKFGTKYNNSVYFDPNYKTFMNRVFHL